MNTKKTPLILNYPNFEGTIQNPLVLVDFWAEWCAPCMVQDPILDEVIDELSERIIVGKVNVDDNRVIANKYGVSNIPTMILFQDGKKVHQFIGVQSKERILQTLKRFL